MIGVVILAITEPQAKQRINRLHAAATVVPIE